MLSQAYLFWMGAGAFHFAITMLVQTRFRPDPKKLVATIVIGAILGYAVGFLAMPTIRILSGAFYGWTMFLIGMGYFSAVTFAGHDDLEEWGAGALASACIFVGGVVVLWIGMFLTSWGGFHAEKYAELITPRLEERDRQLPLVDQTQARLVTSALAQKRGAELISTSDEAALGSRVSVGEMWGNEINGKLVWVAPLEHSGFNRWMSFHTTPGYVTVSQSNELDAALVSDRTMRYLESGWWGENIYRRLYELGLVQYDYDNAVLQIDEDGRPYWLIALIEPQVGFGGKMPVKWALMDAETGETTIAEAEADLPQWIDRAYPQELLSDRFDDWACYSQGALACLWSGEGVIRSTPGVGVTINPDGDMVYYSGTQFQNGQSNGATSGMFIADARTGEITYYRRSGITESTARNIITDAWANYEGYKAAEPIPLVLGNGEAYFSIVLDSNGARKGFGVVSMQNRNLFGIGDSIQAAVTSFNNASRRTVRDAALDAGQVVEAQSIRGIVRTYLPYVVNGRTVFYLTLEGMDDRIFEISEEKIGEIVATQVGDEVSIDVVDATQKLIYAEGFDNLGLGFTGEVEDAEAVEALPVQTAPVEIPLEQ